MIQEDDEFARNSKEVHFMQMEGIHKSYEVNWKLGLELWRAFREKRPQDMRDWIFTDFDHCLNGNPIIRGH